MIAANPGGVQVMLTAAMIVLGYLLGSIPSGFLFGKWAGIDVRKSGSGNVGATNVARVAGKRRGAYTLIADVAKGFIPVFVALQLELSVMAVTWVAIAAFLGHLFPIFLRFKGGKGVATALGVFLALAPFATVIMIGLFGLVFFGCRIVSLSSLIVAAAAPVLLWLFSYAEVITAAGVFIGVMIVLRHRDNIERLLGGNEPKFSG